MHTENSLPYFMEQTGGDFAKAQQLFQQARNEGKTYGSTSRPVTQEIPNYSTRTGYTGVDSSYNPYTGGNESINRDIGVNTEQYNMANKQALWNQHGNQGSFNMDAFYRGADGSLQIKDEYKKDLSSAQNLNDINAAMNQKMIQNFENRNIQSPSPEGFAKYNEQYKHLLTGGKEAPDVYSAVKDLENRRKQYGVAEMEQKMAELNKQMADLTTRNNERKDYAEGKAVPMGVIAGRVSEIEKQHNTRMQYLRNEASYINDRYKTTMNVIEMYMKAGAEDYTRAKERFESDYKRNRDMLDMYKDDIKQQNAQERERMKDAQATLQTIYNGVINGSIEKSSWTPEMENQIAKLELQSGFPMGLIKSVYDKNPKSDIIQQSTANVNGRQVLNLVMRDKQTGQMKVESVDMGQASTPSQNGRYQYKDGEVFDTQTGTISKTAAGLPKNNVTSVIEQCRTTGQCGQGVNDYLGRIGESARMGDAYSTKSKHINSKTPQVGGLAIWQPSGHGAKPEFGHVGIVLEEQGDKVLIHDWNWDGDEKQKTHWVNKSSILKNGGFMTV